MIDRTMTLKGMHGSRYIVPSRTGIRNKSSGKAASSSICCGLPSYLLILFLLLVISGTVFVFDVNGKVFKDSIMQKLRAPHDPPATTTTTILEKKTAPLSSSSTPERITTATENNRDSSSQGSSSIVNTPSKGTDSTQIATNPSISLTSSSSTQVNQVEQTSKMGAILDPPKSSPYAYVTLISGIDKSLRYRGFLYNALIMKRALKDSGSTADFIAMIGFSEKDTSLFDDDMNLLRSQGIIPFFLPRFVDESHPLNFAEMALLKITPWSFTQYERVQFFDGDVMPTKNMDCFFSLSTNTFTVGLVSPLNSGWYLALPNMEDYNYMKEKAVWRLGRDWDKVNGWKEMMPPNMKYRGGKPVKEWEFNGADMDQGLFTHYFIINHGHALLIDTDLRQARSFETGILTRPDVIVDMKTALKCCNGQIPTSFFSHFTGRSKPWMQNITEVVTRRRNNNDLIVWLRHLDSLNLPINSKNVESLGLGSPLGFFNARFPQGGYKTKSINKI